MRIALVSASPPAMAADGIARQRQALGDALLSLGHDVHAFCIAEAPLSTATRVPHHAGYRGRHVNRWYPDLPVLDRPLTDAQLLWELLEREHARCPFDVVDVPLWLAQGAAIATLSRAPVVAWLQTTVGHLVELQSRPARAHEHVLTELDRHVLDRAALVLGDSRAIVDDLSRLYDWRDPGRVHVAWPGLPELPAEDGAPTPTRGCDPARVRVLVVGRLEQRKGTRELLDHLPRLLDLDARLHVTFVGDDNSRSDGFQKATGHTYAEAFAHAHPRLVDRVTFAGILPDAALWQAYAEADVLLHAAHYESFGLVLVEAMRAGLATVAFSRGGAMEVLSPDMARLAAPGDWDGLIDAVAALASDPAARVELGERARRRFAGTFTARAMAERTLEAYARAALVSRPAPTQPRRRSGRIFQATEALQEPDGVGHIIRSHARLLASLGGVTAIQTVFVQPELAALTGRVSATRLESSDTLMLHVYGYTRLMGLIERTTARVIVHYHNITPPAYFPPSSPAFEMTTRGLAQLTWLARRADVLSGDSWFDVEALASHLATPRPTICLYPLVDRAQLLSAPVDEAWLAEQRARKAQRGELVLCFTGRLAPNKRQDLVCEAAARLAREGDRPVRLLLAGSGEASPMVRAIHATARTTRHLEVDLLGSVSDATLRACYRLADAYVSASEHEGFGIPLAEAMAFGVPVIAAGQAAVPETLGRSGILLSPWSAEAAAAAIAAVAGDAARREAVVAAQYENVARFSEAALVVRLRALVRFLEEGTLGDDMVMSDRLATITGPPGPIGEALR
jgi:glycosyltransferase involved in cell wall biosynthesis